MEDSFSFQCALIGMKFYRAFSKHIVLNRVNMVYLKKISRNVCGLTVGSQMRGFHRHITGCRDVSWLSFSIGSPVISSSREKRFGQNEV